MTRSFLIMMLMLCGSVSAAAHSWYDPVCCSERDCAPIPYEAVEITDDGYLVTLRAGDHLMVSSTVVHVVAYADVLKSQDGEYHACLFPNQNVMRCFYAPPIGS
jgi:hypothetical protein